MGNHLQPGGQWVPGLGPELCCQFRAVQLLCLGQCLSHYLQAPVTGETGKRAEQMLLLRGEGILPDRKVPYGGSLEVRHQG